MTPPKSLEERAKLKLQETGRMHQHHQLADFARQELQALKEEVVAFCKSKNWQTDEHWFAAEDLIDFINKRMK